MRKLFCVLVILLNVCWVNIALAQNTNPNYGIFFQAVARDNFSNPAKDRVVFVESSILQFTANGTKVLTELHQTTTDGLGVFSINIGSGQRIGGILSGLDKVDWANGPYFLGLKIAIKPLSPVSNWDYTKELIDLGASSFGTVPYAYYAGNSAGVKDVVKTTDTAAMLLPYAKSQTLIALGVNKLNVADSISKYVTPTQLAAKTFDSTAIYNQLALKANSASVTTSLATKLNIADSITKYVTPTQLASKTFDSSTIYNQLGLKANTTNVTTALNTKENLANKSIDVSLDGTSDIKYPSVKAIKTYVDGSIVANTTPLTFAAPLSKSGLTVSIPQANSSVNGYLNASDWTSFNNKIDASQKAANNGVATLGNDGKIPSNQIPSISFQSATVVASQAAMLSIAGAQVGSIAIRTDNNKNYVLSNIPSTTLSNWIELATPNSVTSVNGFAGPNVVLTTNDVNEGSTNKYYTDARVRGAISATAPMLFNSTNGAFSITQASITTDGFLSATDWNIFNNKQNALTAGTDYVTPSQITLTSLGAEAVSNKSNNILADSASTTKYPSVKMIKDYVDQQSANAGVADNSISTAKISGAISINKGGTGATTAVAARTNLGLVIGTDVMAANATTTLTGDVAGSGNGSFATTVNSVGGVSSSTIATLPTTVATNTINITSNTNSITANTASITANATAIAAEATTARAAEQTLTTNLTALTTTVSANTASITANAIAIAAEAITARAAEQTLTTNLTALTTTVSANTASITANATAIAAEATTARAAEQTLTTNLTALTTTVSANTASITANTASINNLTTSVNANTATITANATAIAAEATTARAAEQTLTTNLTALTTTVNANTASINNLTTSVNANTASITANATAITAEATTARAAEQTLTTNLTALTTTVNANTASITANASAITAEATAARAAEQALTNNVNANTASITTNTADILLKAPIASPTFTGTPSAPTPATIDNSTKIATTEYVKANLSMVSAGTLTGTTLASTITGSSLTSVGTITSGVWSGTTIALANGGTGATTATGALTNLGAEPSVNKSFATDLGNSNPSDVLFPSQKAVKAYVDAQAAAAGVADGSITNAKLAGNIAASKLIGTDITTLGTITAGTWNGSTIGLTIGGTGATTAAGARTNLGLVIGTDVMAANYTTTLTGDVTGAGNGSFVTTLANSGVTSGTYGSSTTIPVLTVDTKGRVTLASSVGIVAGVNSLNYTSATSYAAGGTTSGTNLTLAAADASNPGLISTGAQTIAGAKTFNNDVTAPNFLGNATTATTAGNITATSNTTLTTLSNLAAVGTITSGVWSGTTIALANGGTGSTTAAGARTNLGLVIGTDVMSATASTTLTGDVTGSGNGSFATTLTASGVSSGTYGSSTAIPTFTVDSKGRLTTASTASIIADAGTLSGTTLKSTVVTSSLSSVATITSGVWNGSVIGIAYGGTGSTTKNFVDLTTAQTIAGVKTFSSDIVANGLTIGIGGGGINTNTASGYQSLQSNTTGSQNTANGYQALQTNTTGSQNTANGYQSLQNNTLGSQNAANGYQALYRNTIGNWNTANGFYALNFNTSGSNNTAIGQSTLYKNTTGTFNSAIGDNALFNNTEGGNNSAIGQAALYLNTTGNNNTASGYLSLFNSTGSNNTANGTFALYSTTTGANNTAIGYEALDNNTTGNYNTALGYGADVAYGNLSNTTAIGYGALVSESNAIQLGNGAVSKVNTSGSITASGLSLTGNLSAAAGTFSSTLSAGASTLASASITGATSLSTLTASGNSTLTSLTATGAATFSSTVKISTGAGAGKVLISDASGLATWSNSIGSTVVTTTAAYSITLAESIIFYTGTVNGTFSIPAAATSNLGKEITIKNKTGYTITITPATGNIYIDNANSTAAFVSIGIEASNNWIKLVSDGTQWNVLRALF